MEGLQLMSLLVEGLLNDVIFPSRLRDLAVLIASEGARVLCKGLRAPQVCQPFSSLLLQRSDKFGLLLAQALERPAAADPNHQIAL